MMGNQISVEWIGDAKKLLKAMDRMEQRQKRLEAGYKKVGGASRKAGDQAGKAGDQMGKAGQQGENAFGAKAVASLKNYALGFVGVGTAIAGATKLLVAMNAERERAAEFTKEGATGIAPLAQLAMGDPAKLRELTTAAKSIYLQGGAASLGEAGGTAFELESAGALGEAGMFAKLYGVTDAGQLAKSGAILRKAMGAGEAGSFQQILSKGLAAAGPLPGVGASQIIEASSRGAKMAGLLGLGDEELLAATSVVSQATESSERGGTQVASLMRSLARQGFVEQFKGKSLGEMLESIREKKMTTPELIEFFGRHEAAQAFLALEPEAYTQRLGEIQQAQQHDVAGQVIAAAMENPLLATVRRGRQAEAAKMLSQGDLGQQAVSLDTAQAEMYAGGRLSGEPRALTTARDIGANLTKGLTGWIVGEERLKAGIQWGQEIGLYPSGRGVGGAIQERLVEDEAAIRRREQAARRARQRAEWEAEPVEFVEQDDGTFAPLKQAAADLKGAAAALRGGPTLAHPDEDR